MKIVLSAFVSLCALSATVDAQMVQAPEKVCRNAQATIAMSVTLRKDPLICLDSFQMNGTERTLFYREKFPEAILVVDTKSSPGGTPDRLLHVSEINEPGLFPNACGAALLSARVLPPSGQIALLYDADVIRLADVKKNTMTKIFDPRPKDAAYMCLGYVPSKDALRDVVSVNAAKKLIEFSFNNYTKKEIVCRDITAADLEYYQDDYLPSLLGSLEKMKAGLDAETDESMKDYWIDGIKLREKMIAELEEKIKTQKDCREQAVREKGSMAY